MLFSKKIFNVAEDSDADEVSFFRRHGKLRIEQGQDHLEAWRLVHALIPADGRHLAVNPVKSAGRVMRYPNTGIVIHGLITLCETTTSPVLAKAFNVTASGTTRRFRLDPGKLRTLLEIDQSEMARALRMMRRHRVLEKFRMKHGLLWITCDIRVLDAFVFLAALDGYETGPVMDTQLWRRALYSDYVNETAPFDPAESTLPKWSYEV